MDPPGPFLSLSTILLLRYVVLFGALAAGSFSEILAQINKAAKSLLSTARKVPSIYIYIVRFTRDDVHCIRMNLYLHCPVVIVQSEL